MKAKFDYGLVIFMLTYALILVSGFKISLSEDTRLAWERLFVILMASIICLVICIGIFPAWAGTDLHNLIASTFDDLSLAVEGIKHNISNYQDINIYVWESKCRKFSVHVDCILTLRNSLVCLIGKKYFKSS